MEVQNPYSISADPVPEGRAVQPGAAGQCFCSFSLFLFYLSQVNSAEPVFPLPAHLSLLEYTFGTVLGLACPILCLRPEGPGILLFSWQAIFKGTPGQHRGGRRGGRVARSPVECAV